MLVTSARGSGAPYQNENQVKGLHAVRIRERDATATVDFLTNVLGFSFKGVDAGWHRFGIAGGGSLGDLWVSSRRQT